jgi:hypothetical protein
VSYDGEEGTGANDAKITKVKGYVQKMQAMLSGKKQTEIEEVKMKQDYRFAENDFIVDEEEAEEEDYSKKKRKRGGRTKQTARKSTGGKAPCVMSKAARLLETEACFDEDDIALQEPEPTQQQQPQLSKKSQESHTQQKKQSSDQQSEGAVVVDYTKIPVELEQKFDELDENNALRPTIITPGQNWFKKSQPSLLSDPQTSMLSSEVSSIEFKKRRRRKEEMKKKKEGGDEEE